MVSRALFLTAAGLLAATAAAPAQTGSSTTGCYSGYCSTGGIVGSQSFSATSYDFKLSPKQDRESS